VASVSSDDYVPRSGRVASVSSDDYVPRSGRVASVSSDDYVPRSTCGNMECLKLAVDASYYHHIISYHCHHDITTPHMLLYLFANF